MIADHLSPGTALFNHPEEMSNDDESHQLQVVVTCDPRPTTFRHGFTSRKHCSCRELRDSQYWEEGEAIEQHDIDKVDGSRVDRPSESEFESQSSSHVEDGSKEENEDEILGVPIMMALYQETADGKGHVSTPIRNC